MTDIVELKERTASKSKSVDAEKAPMNEGARQANHDADVWRAANKQAEQIKLLKEIRDMLRRIEMAVLKNAE